MVGFVVVMKGVIRAVLQHHSRYSYAVPSVCICEMVGGMLREKKNDRWGLSFHTRSNKQFKVFKLLRVSVITYRNAYLAMLN